MQRQLQDIQLPLTADSRETGSRQQISFRVSCSDVPQSLQRNISVQGMRVSISGRIQTGSYTNKDGVKVYTTEVIVEEQEFAESRAESEANRASFQQSAPAPAPSAPAGDGFMNIPDGIDEELPFN